MNGWLTWHRGRRATSWAIGVVILALAPWVWAQGNTEFGFPTVPLKELPQPLRVAYQDNKPEMNDRSRCAAAFDPSGDLEKMTLKCSIYIRMAAEGARRAMNYCEEKRQELRIKAPCRVVKE